MDDRLTEFRVGVVLVATIIVLGILIMFFGEFGGFVTKQYTVYVGFRHAPGVTVNTPVRKSGVLIGRVSEVTLEPDSTVLVKARIDAHRTIPKSDICRIRTGNILGDAELEFVPGPEPSSTFEVYKDGVYITGVVTENPLNAVGEALGSIGETVGSMGEALDIIVAMEDEIRGSLTSIQRAGDEVGRAAGSLGSVVVDNQDQMQRIMTKTEQAMDRFEIAMASIDEFVRDDELRGKLNTALDQVPVLFADARETMESWKSVAVRAEKNLANIEAVTEPLGQAGDALFSDVGETIGRLDTVMEELTIFSKQLNASEGTLGQLIHNRELYDRLNGAASNIEDVSARLRPIVNDARVFTDKIARNPGRLGLQGALSRRQSGTKY